MVERPRLDDRLTGADPPPLTLVSAPAGFGKTTLVVEWLQGARAAGRCTAWLSLDQNDNDPTLFWSYVTASLGAAGAITVDPATVDRSQAPLDSLVTSLVNDLARLGREVVLVLDDFHRIESTEVQASVMFLLDHLPHHVHLVIATRSDPPWPLGQWRARGDLLEVRASDLRFSADEASRFLADAMGLEVTPEEVAALEDRTEGWIAALQLAALSIQGREDVAGFIEAFTGDDRHIVDYLVEEVLLRQTPADREFLLETSVLDRLTGALCDAVTGGTGAKGRLDRLERANLFLVALDDHRRWYRYHHLFADVLRARLLDESPELATDLHRRAAEWFEQHGDHPEAIDHAIAGADFDRAARLVELSVPLIRRTRQDATLNGWIDSLPDEVVATRPVLGVALVGAWMSAGELDRAAAGLDAIEQAIAADTGPDGLTRLVVDDDLELRRLPAQAALYRAAMGLVAGHLDQATVQARLALELIDADDHLGRGAATALIGLARWTSGDLGEAEERYVEAIASLEAIGHLSDALGCRLGLSDIQTARGHLGDAMATVQAGLATTDGRPAMRGTADMHVALADLLCERGDLDGALRHLDLAHAHGDALGLPQNPHRSRLVSARVHQAQRDLTGALELITEAGRLYNGDYSPDVRPVAAVEARVRIAMGDLDAARHWARDQGVTVDHELTYLREFEHLTLARLLVASLLGSASVSARTGHDEASILLDRLLADAERGEREGRAVEVLVLQALHAHAAGRRELALERLADALERAEPECIVRVFLDEGEPMAALLRAVADGSRGSTQARAVLAAGAAIDAANAGSTEPRPSSDGGLVDPLSARELDVLRLLRTELTGPQIASELHVSLNTMRTHTKAIYTKLGVNSRRAAVRHAAELGL